MRKSFQPRTILPFINGKLLAVFILTIIAFLPTFFNGFTNWDDLDQVTQNPDITSLSIHNLKIIFSSFYVGMYQPLTTFCFAIIFKFFGLKAAVFHTFSLLLHLFNIILVYQVLKKITDKKEILIAVTLFFAINPLQTEAVAWVSATSTLMYSMFYLLSVNAYILFAKDKNTNNQYYFSLLFFLAALLSKSAAVTLPIVLLLSDYFLFSKITKKNILNKMPFFILSIIFGIITIIARQEASHIIDITKYYSIFDRILFIFYSLTFYIYAVFTPFKMSAFHAYPNNTGALPIIYYLMPLFLIAIIIFLIKIKENKKEILFGFLFFLFSIFVMIELIPVGLQIVKERYTYISCIGLYFAFFTFLFSVISKNEKLKKIITYGIVLLSLVFIFSSFIRTLTWKDSFSLWNDVIKKYPDCSAAYINRGNANVIDEKYENAIIDLSKAIALEPKAADAFIDRAIAKSKSNDLFGALTDYNIAISIGPADDKMYAERAVLKSGTYDIAGSIDDISLAIGLNPGKEKYYNQRGIYFGMTGSFEKAKNDFTKAIELNPDYPDAWSNKGYAELNLADFQGAISDLTIALNKNSSEARTFYLRGMAYLQIKKENEACSDFRKAYDMGMTEAGAEIEKNCGK